VIEGSRAGAYLLYVRTRGAEETGERREINPAAPPAYPRGWYFLCNSFSLFLSTCV